MLTYKYGQAELYNPNSGSYIYQPPASIGDFQIMKVILKDKESYTIKDIKGYTIALVLAGTGEIKSTDSTVRIDVDICDRYGHTRTTSRSSTQ